MRAVFEIKNCALNVLVLLATINKEKPQIMQHILLWRRLPFTLGKKSAFQKVFFSRGLHIRHKDCFESLIVDKYNKH